MADHDASTRERLLELLKCRGTGSAQELATELDRTPVAIRQLLGRLREEDLVRSEERCEGPGRPAQIWSLTERGHATFADRHGALAAGLLSALHSLEGDAGVARVLEERARQQRRAYAERLREAGPDLARRVETLARLRTQEGYMAAVEPAADGGFVLVENHCPIAQAARCCGKVCDTELGLFQAALGDEVEVARVEHQREGDRRCTYRIRPRA